MNVNLSRPPTPSSYGLAIPRSRWGPLGVISSPERSCAGNIVFHVGHEIPEGGWTKSEHVVLTPEEARAVIGQMLELLDRGTTNHGNPFRQRYAEWAAHRSRLSAAEEAGQGEAADAWEFSDDTAVELLREAAAFLGCEP
jgi:hypothetical protein